MESLIEIRWWVALAVVLACVSAGMVTVMGLLIYWMNQEMEEMRDLMTDMIDDDSPDEGDEEDDPIMKTPPPTTRFDPALRN